MIIVVHGTKNGKRSSAPTMALLASLTMLQRNKKVLVLPLCEEGTGLDIERLMDANLKIDRVASSSIGGMHEFEDNGVDAFLRQTSAGRLTTKHFDDYTIGMAKIKNYLDVTPATTTPDFETSLLDMEEDIRMIFNGAESVYNYTFVLADSRNEDLTEMLDEIADKIIVTVRQGNADELPWDEEKKGKEIRQKAIFVVEDYEKESGFDLGLLKKTYHAKQMFAIPHNIQYRDAIEAGNILQYALKNATAGATDINYEVSNVARLIMDRISGKSADDEDENEAIANEITEKPETEETAEVKEEIPAGQVKRKQHVTKKGFFGKKTVTRKTAIEDEISIMDDFEAGEDDTDEEDFDDE